MTSEAPRILVLGFQPFGGEAINPAGQLPALLDGARVAGHRVLTGVLPVTFADCGAALEAAIEAADPVIVLGIGQAGGRARMSIERVAINLVDARIADNAGSQPVDVPVIEGAPGAWFATLPVKRMLRAMLDCGVPAELSLSAGTFVCNAMFFALLHACATRWPRVRAGFVHLPYLPEQAARHPDAPSMHLQTMRSGVLAALEAAATHAADSHEAAGTLC